MSIKDLPQNDVAITREEIRGMMGEVSYAGVTSFARCKYTKDLTGVDVAISGVPFDCSVTHRSGSRFGPRQIREMSAMLAWDAPYGWPVNPFEALSIVDYGDCPFDHGKIHEVPAAIEHHVRTILEAGAASVIMGGDHFITLPILKAHAEKHGPVSFIQFDAHSDTWADDDPDRIDHGTFMYHAVKRGYVQPASSVQVGIRTTNPDPLGVNTLDARFVHEHGPVATAKRIKEIVGDTPTYITFDIDGLDPAFAPGTGTPVFGGLTSGQVAIILRDIAGINIIGGDVVEVSPPYDTSGATAVAGSQIVLELLCLLANKHAA
ncbi:agmatinase [Ruegeria marisrubri]|uniref:Agmatinase n=1 Tax=Ruegeria marisrubri TaxID=1685379 RepID=A0A101CZN8_9RHOB|nr:agmatinase [Ruegeria marisrubri]KUJ86185.1 agmatinase [Ruegeria marisrubri]